MLLEALVRAPHHPEDVGVAHDDDDAGQREADDEERGLGGVAVAVGVDGAGAEFLVEAVLAPLAEQRGDLEAVAEEPDGGDVDGHLGAGVDLAKSRLGLRERVRGLLTDE